MTLNNREFSWKMLENQWLQVIIYVVMIAYFIIWRPNLYIILSILTIYIVFRTIYYKRGWKIGIVSLIYLGLIFSIIYAVGLLIGNTAVIILVHVLGVPLILWSRRTLLKKAFTEMWRHSREMGRKHKRYKEWKKLQKSKKE